MAIQCVQWEQPGMQRLNYAVWLGESNTLSKAAGPWASPFPPPIWIPELQSGRPMKNAVTLQIPEANEK